MRFRRAFRAIGIAVVACILLGVALTWFVGSKLIEPLNHTVVVPGGFSAEKVSISGVDHAIAGWWVDAGSGTPVVLLVHGLGADRSAMVPRAELLKKRGFSSLLIDLPGGETTGNAITMGFRESKDVIAARDWIRAKSPGQKIGVIGTSLGGASVLLAPQPAGFDAVVLESVYPRIGRAVENRIRMQLGFLASILTPLLLAQLEPRLHIEASELEPIRWIGKLGAPVLVAAGSKDHHTTLEETQELFDAAAQPKSLWIVEGAVHEDLLTYDPKGYEEHVVGFLRQNLGQKTDSETVASWDSLGKTVNGNEETFVDPASIRIDGKIRRGSSKVVLAARSQAGAGEYSGKWVSYFEYRFAFNCADRVGRMEGITGYFEDGTTYIDRDYPKPWRPVPTSPKTKWTALMEYVCAWKATPLQ